MGEMDRRGFIKLAGLGGGIVFASSLGLDTLGSVLDYANKKVEKEFYFVQLSDTHWGFSGPKVNPDAEGTLKKAVRVVNSLEEQPDFIVFTGDLTHTTDNVQVRKDRMAQFKDIAGQLKV
ncbi:MAG TPA: metallophosphoesterase, partial [Nitrososphaera sp.]|nr:metallophosphoesterase [Nitrososphaera sp.]